MKNLFIFLAIVAVGTGGGMLAFIFMNQSAEEVVEYTPSEEEEREPTFIIEEIPATGIEDMMPDLNRAVVFEASFPAEAQSILNQRFSEITARLKADPMRADDWFDLAIVYHTANDYAGARAVWEFLTQVIPHDATAHDNLGKLYHFSLKEYAKSEASLRRSLEINPDSLAPYIELHNLYRYSYKTETTAGADILRQAMARFPDNFDLYLFLGSYYIERGNRPAAREVLLEGMDKARAAGDVDAMATIGSELERF